MRILGWCPSISFERNLERIRKSAQAEQTRVCGMTLGLRKRVAKSLGNSYIATQSGVDIYVAHALKKPAAREERAAIPSLEQTQTALEEHVEMHSADRIPAELGTGLPKPKFYQVHRVIHVLPGRRIFRTYQFSLMEAGA